MNFLITGAGGFVGHHLTSRLNADGHKVYTDYIDVTDVYDINDTISYFNRKSKIDGVFNLAAKTHPPTSFDEPVEYFEVNAMGAVFIAEAVRIHCPEAILMQCSTCEVYGIHPDGTHINENTPCLPPNPYAVSKYAGELYINERCKNGMLKAFITRGFSHTGPGRPSNYSISSDAIQIAQILKRNADPVIRVGNLECKRVVMDVRDVVGVYASLMYKYIDEKDGKLYSAINGGIYNIGGDNLYTMGFFLDTMLDIYGLKGVRKEIDPLLYRKFDIPVQYPDSTKVRNFIKWQPQYDINETLTDLVEYWKERV